MERFILIWNTHRQLSRWFNTSIIMTIKSYLRNDTSSNSGHSEEGIADSPCGSHGSELLVHAKTYALADQFMVHGLKALSLQKFRTAAKEHWSTHYFLDAAQEIFESTQETDEGMRAAIIEVFCTHLDLLHREETQRRVKEVGSLAFELLMGLRQRHQVIP